MIYVKNNILLVASAAVSNTDVRKPINGTLITGRYFTKELLQEISNDIALPLSLFLIDDFPHNKRIQSIIKINSLQHVIYENKKIAYGYVVLRDIYKKPIGVIRITIPRTSYTSGLKAVNYYLTMLFMSAFMLSAFFWYFLKKFVLNRVEGLIKKIQDIDKRQNFSARLPIYYDDELSLLQKHFNKLMNTIQVSNERSEDHIQQLVISQNRLENMNKKLINEVNERKQAEAEAKAKSLSDILVLASRRAGMADITSSVIYSVSNILNHIRKRISFIKEHMQNKETSSENNQYIINEIANIEESTEQMNNVIMMQSSLSGVTEILEEIKLSKIIDESLMLNKSDYKNFNIKIIKDFQFNANIVADRVKLLHILANTLRYIIYLLRDSDKEPKDIIILTESLNELNFAISISCKACHISSEDAKNIMTFELNTKYNQNNFDIKTSVMFSKDMGGSLSVKKLDAGFGAVIKIVLPIMAHE